MSIHGIALILLEAWAHQLQSVDNLQGLVEHNPHLMNGEYEENCIVNAECRTGESINTFLTAG